MRVLVACEESQAVCKAFRLLGHEAYSCDILDCSGGHPEWHIKGDALLFLKPPFAFWTQDGTEREIVKWDMVIAFPPCTYLSNAGACRLYDKPGVLNKDRYEKGLKAKEFFMAFLNADCPKIAVENPIQTKVFNIPQYQQIIQPYMFGHPYSKKTCLWLKGLPPLIATQIVKDTVSWVSGGSKDSKGNKRKNLGTKFRDSKTKSKTFPGIAKAMAEQWGGICE